MGKIKGILAVLLLGVLCVGGVKKQRAHKRKQREEGEGYYEESVSRSRSRSRGRDGSRSRRRTYSRERSWSRDAPFRPRRIDRDTNLLDVYPSEDEKTEWGFPFTPKKKSALSRKNKNIYII